MVTNFKTNIWFNHKCKNSGEFGRWVKTNYEYYKILEVALKRLKIQEKMGNYLKSIIIWQCRKWLEIYTKKIASVHDYQEYFNL